MLTKAPRGTRDILPDEIHKWYYVEEKFKQICHLFGYREIRLPVLSIPSFSAWCGDTCRYCAERDVHFNDKGGRSITLRPEGTAGVVRSYIENRMSSWPQPVKFLNYSIPV